MTLPLRHATTSVPDGRTDTQRQQIKTECVWDETYINNIRQTAGLVNPAEHMWLHSCLLMAGEAGDWDAEAANVRLRETTALGTMDEDDSDLPGDDLRTSHASDVGLHQQLHCTPYSHCTVAWLLITLLVPLAYIILSSFITNQSSYASPLQSDHLNCTAPVQLGPFKFSSIR